MEVLNAVVSVSENKNDAIRAQGVMAVIFLSNLRFEDMGRDDALLLWDGLSEAEKYAALKINQEAEVDVYNGKIPVQ